MSTRKYDIIVLGASGFTGRLVIQYLIATYGTGGDLKWAIAGRNQSKLEEVRALYLADKQQASLPILLADSSDPVSLAALAQSTRVICTTVGPYALYGTAVVDACVAAGTHYCDLTGEVHWMAKIISTYQVEAENSGARIVHTCGFDSIPFDLGAWFLQDAMIKKHGVPALEIKTRVGGFSGAASGGTIASMLNMLAEADDNPSILEIMDNPYSLNPEGATTGPDGADQSNAVYDPHFEQWTSPFVMAAVNTRVVRRSNALLNFLWGKDFRYNEATLCKSRTAAIRNAVAGKVGMGLLSKPGVRRLAARVLPKPGEGPSQKAREEGFYELFFHGIHPLDRNKDIRVKVSGDMDPGYGSTSKMLAESAVCLAKDDIEVGGGMWTPASAMNELLLDRLTNNAGLKFEIIPVS
ncbi:MAG: short subunit dehydrogenase-like uncharacterized protein [Halioglobus sp.]|jgi:short subunit dehydrogenase-like uncharacterized protein